MTDYILNTTSSYTLLAGSDGTLRLDLSGDLTAVMTAATESGMTDVQALFAAASVMDKAHATQMIEALASLVGMDGAIGKALASGDSGALADAIGAMAGERSAGWTGEFPESGGIEGFGSDLFGGGWEKAGPTTLEDMLGFGTPSDPTLPEGGGEEGGGLVLPGQEGLMISAGAVVAVVGLIAVAVYYDELKDTYEEVSKKIDEEVNFMPADPDGEGKLTREQFDAQIEKLDLGEPDPTTTMPADPDAGVTSGPTLDESEIDDLGQLTQPGSPDEDHIVAGALIDADDPMGLDPLINPGEEDVDGFVFTDLTGGLAGTGNLGGGGENFVMLADAPLTVEVASVEAHDPVLAQDGAMAVDCFDFV